jgi:bifunctional DNA-binding transcriptional regulator/antitoxin component of YhaV-PrlF toxin-antitoxin module
VLGTSRWHTLSVMARQKKSLPPLRIVHLRVGRQRRIVLPVELGLREGDEVTMIVERSGRVVLSTVAQAIARAQRRWAKLAPRGRSLSEDLIRERRAEARREREG